MLLYDSNPLNMAKVYRLLNEKTCKWQIICLVRHIKSVGRLANTTCLVIIDCRAMLCTIYTSLHTTETSYIASQPFQTLKSSFTAHTYSAPFRLYCHAFQTLLSRCHCENLPVIQLSYDTTFNMGDFYMSVLLYRHTEFNESPVIPLSFLIHERKLNSTHINFFTYMKSACPDLANSQHLLIVTNNEQATRNSLRTVLPELRAFLRWNHLF